MMKRHRAAAAGAAVLAAFVAAGCGGGGERADMISAFDGLTKKPEPARVRGRGRHAQRRDEARDFGDPPRRHRA